MCVCADREKNLMDGWNGNSVSFSVGFMSLSDRLDQTEQSRIEWMRTDEKG